MTTLTWALEADLNRDGAYEENLTSRVTTLTQGMTFERGIDKGGQYKISEFSLSLKNHDGRYSAENPAGALYGMLEPGADVRLTITLNGVGTICWRGFIARWDGIQVDAGKVTLCTVRIRDVLEFLNTYANLNVVTSTTRTTDQALAAIFTAMGISSSLYSLDVGQQTLGLHFVRMQNALQAAMDIIKSEMGGFLYANKAGLMRFENRASRIGQGYKKGVVKDAPIAYWRLGEGSGTAARDDGSGSAATGTYTAGYTLAQAAGIPDPDYCVSLNGTTGFVALGTPAKLDLTGAWTLEGWWDPNGGSVVSKGLVGRLQVAGGDVNFFLGTGLNGANTSRLQGGFRAGGAWKVAVDSVNLPASSGAQHCVITWDGTTLKLYRNGAQVGTATPGVADASAGGAYVIGKDPSAANFLAGLVDEVAIYSTALSATRVLEHYLAGARNLGDGSPLMTDGRRSVMPFHAEYNVDNEELVTSVTVEPTIFLVDQDVKEVFRFSRGMQNRPADSLEIPGTADAQGRSPIYEADWHYDAAVVQLTAPTAYQDYLGNSNISGTGTDRTSSLTVTATDQGGGLKLRIVNSHANSVYVTVMRVRGTTVAYAADKPKFVAIKTIPGQTADRSLAVSLPFTDDTALKAADFCYGLLRQQRYPVPQVVVDFQLERSDQVAAAMIGMELGSIIKYKDTAVVDRGGKTVGAVKLYVNEWLYVENISIRGFPGKPTTCRLIGYPTYAYRDLSKIVYDLFTRADAATLGTALKGGAWANTAQTAIATNKARPSNAAVQTPNLALGAADCVVEVSVSNITASPATTMCGLIYRFSDTSNYWRAYIDKAALRVKLDKVVAGVATNMASTVWVAADTAELQVIAQGNRHRVRITTPAGLRTFVADVTDADLKDSTAVGLYALNTTLTDFDDFMGQGL